MYSAGHEYYIVIFYKEKKQKKKLPFILASTIEPTPCQENAAHFSFVDVSSYGSFVLHFF